MKKLVLAMCGAALLLGVVGFQAGTAAEKKALWMDPGVPIDKVVKQTDL